MKKALLLLSLVTLIAACGSQLPENYAESNAQPDIYPDYKGVTVPVNMAPLTFEMAQEAESMVARLTADGEELLLEGDKIQPDRDDWQRLVTKAADKKIGVEVFARYDGKDIKQARAALYPLFGDTYFYEYFLTEDFIYM